MPIVEVSGPVTGGIDTHLDAHVAAVVDVNGGVLAVESFPTTTAGFAELHDWLAGSVRWNASVSRALVPTAPAWLATCGAGGWR
jgi:hypothetical protein